MVAMLGLIPYIFISLTSDMGGFMRKRVVFTLLATLIALFIVTCGKKEPVIATIGTKRSLTETQFIESFKRGKTKEAMQSSTLEKRLEHLDQMIEEHLIVLEAYAKGLDKDSTIASKMIPVFRKLVLEKLYREEIIDKTIREVDVREYYARMRKEVEIRHIFFRVPGNATPEEEEEIRKKGLAILGRIRSGDKFEELALMFSEDNRTAPKEGYLGALNWSTTPGPIREAAFSMRPGQVSDLIRNENGYHIIRVEEIRKTKVKPYSVEQEEIRRNLFVDKRAVLSENGQMYVQRVRESKKIEWNQDGLETLKDLLKNIKDPKRNVIIDTMKALSAEDNAVVLVQTEEGPFTVLNYLDKLYSVPARNRILIYEIDHIKSTIDQWLVSDYLYEIGLKKKLDKDPEVSDKLQEAREREMAQLFKQREFQKEPQYTDDDLRAFFEEHINDYYEESEKSKSFDKVKETIALDYVNYQNELLKENWLKDKKEEYSVHIDESRLENLFEAK
jgi:parvulin-like peptidyl-prolyl isomerase